MKRESWISIRSLIAVLLAVALVAAACGDDDDIAGISEEPAAEQDSSDDAEEEPAPAEEPADEAVADTEGERADAGGDRGGDGAGPNADEPAEEAAGEPAVGAESSRDGGGLFDDRDEGRSAPTPEPNQQRDNRFQDYGIRDFVDTDDDPLSTFALDVDTGSYSIARQWLTNGALPPPDAVRVEEYVNAFHYGYHEPDDALGVTVDGGPSPFDKDNYLVRIGVQSERIDDDQRPDASLTFVIDTSGSMSRGRRLDLVKESLRELIDELGRKDTVAIVEFDDDPSIVLEPTDVDREDDILDAIDNLSPGGSTNVESGLDLGYELAGDMFGEERVNRVILLSDGVANVGLTDPDGLAEMIRRDADRGIQLLTIGVGMGNFNDVLLEQLADQGDGFYAYVDTEDEAERLFEDNLTSTLVTLAIDAKIQVEFAEDVVEAYRLIGFENRGVRDRDFRNDRVDAGEIGAGHQVTAIYEIELARGVDLDDRDELGEVRLRWEEPVSGEVTEIERDIDLRMIDPSWEATSDDFKLAVVVATFAEILRGSPFADDIDLDDLEEEAEALADELQDRDVDELVDLLRLADRHR